MKISDAGRTAAAIGILAASLTGFHDQARAASGRINIQTAPEGARYLIVTSKDLSMVQEGISPYFDTAFPTGRYKVCFELDGYETVWQDSAVSTFGSSWIGPLMERSKSAARPACEDDLLRIKTERGIIKSSVLQTIKQAERTAPSESTEPPAVAPAAPIKVDHDHDTYDRSRSDKAGEIRQRAQDKRAVGSK